MLVQRKVALPTTPFGVLKESHAGSATWFMTVLRCLDHQDTTGTFSRVPHPSWSPVLQLVGMELSSMKWLNSFCLAIKTIKCRASVWFKTLKTSQVEVVRLLNFSGRSSNWEWCLQVYFYLFLQWQWLSFLFCNVLRMTMKDSSRSLLSVSNLPLKVHNLSTACL